MERLVGLMSVTAWKGAGPLSKVGTYRFPSLPKTITLSEKIDPPMNVSVFTPAGVMEPTLSPMSVTYQMFPSGPRVIPRGCEDVKNSVVLEVPVDDVQPGE